MARDKRRPLFDGTTWLVLLWGAAMGVGILAGITTMGEYPSDGSEELRAAALRNFLSGAGPFWIVGGVSLALSLAVDEMSAQFRRSRDES